MNKKVKTMRLFAAPMTMSAIGSLGFVHAPESAPEQVPQPDFFGGRKGRRYAFNESRSNRSKRQNNSAEPHNKTREIERRKRQQSRKGCHS